ncbi:pyridoxamine 5'-phosphate oxidase family protein [Embleya sp. NPDC050154]|uniref:pyridoxamine 5'-phosphate oxidase family protein n=1 Tax=Embleya sp. NPDC050154 TaxID=3363988 RepID=UPI0037B58069
MSEHPVTKRPLDRRETLELMAGAQVGRVVVSEGALPAVHLVVFAVDRECVVFRTPVDSPLARAALDAVVAFQADHIDRAARTGWTGTVTGQASRVLDPAAVARVERLLPEVDGDDGEQAWFQITSEFVTGRLVQRAAAVPSPGGPKTS